MDDSKIIASLATIAGREEACAKAVTSLMTQVDQVWVFRNSGTYRAPAIVRDQVLVADEDNSQGDAAKFLMPGGASIEHHYRFTCDDDLVYPKGYVQRMIHKIEQYKRKAVVGLHGSVMPEVPESYLYREPVYHCLHPLDRDVPVNMLGTGVLAFHTSTIKVVQSMFKKPNMADIWFALACQRQRVPMVCVARTREQCPTHIHHDDTIWRQTVKDGDADQVEAMKERTPWQLRVVEPS